MFSDLSPAPNSLSAACEETFGGIPEQLSGNRWRTHVIIVTTLVLLLLLLLLLHLWREEALDPAGEEGLVQDAADGRPLSRAAPEQQRQQRTQLRGVVARHGRVGAADDLQHQVLHVARLELRRQTGRSVREEAAIEARPF